MSVSMPVELETDGTVGTLAKQVAWLLGGEVEVTTAGGAKANTAPMRRSEGERG